MMSFYFVKSEFECIPATPLLLERAVDKEDGVEGDKPSEQVEPKWVVSDAEQLNRLMLTWSMAAIRILAMRSPGSQ